MSCNKPLLGVYGDLLPSGKRKVELIGRYDYELAKDYPGSMRIPCGKCLGCRADYCREWADRMILELDHSKKAVFLTLTYDDDHLPVLYQVTTGQCQPTLQKRDVQLFMKRIRKYFRDREIRVYYSGEYGSRTYRPHYHMILYGVGLEDFPDLYERGKNELGQPYYVSDWLALKMWKLGFCQISPVSWKTCAYVARYVEKKNYGLVSDEFVDRMQQPTFSESSRNPGIGMYYPLEHPEYAEQSKYYFSDQNGSVEVHFPRAFLRYLEASDPLLYQELKDQRREFANDNMFLKMKQTDLFSAEMDEISENRISSTKNIIDSYRIL